MLLVTSALKALPSFFYKNSSFLHRAFSSIPTCHATCPTGRPYHKHLTEGSRLCIFPQLATCVCQLVVCVSSFECITCTSVAGKLFEVAFREHGGQTDNNQSNHVTPMPSWEQHCKIGLAGNCGQLRAHLVNLAYFHQINLTRAFVLTTTPTQLVSVASDFSW